MTGKKPEQLKMVKEDFEKRKAETIHKNLLDLMKGGRVKRYHAETLIGHQTVAEHSWGVAMLVDLLWPECNAELILAAIYHDTHEGELGDLPAPTKRVLNAATPVLKNWEKAFHVRTMTDYESTLSEEDTARLRIADYLELVLFCQHQCGVGNTYIKAVGRAGVEYVEAILEEYPDVLSRESYILVTIILSS